MTEEEKPAPRQRRSLDTSNLFGSLDDEPKQVEPRAVRNPLETLLPKSTKPADADPLDALMPKVNPASSDADALDALMPKPRATKPAEADPLDALMPKVKPASSDADALDALMPKPRAPKPVEADPLDALMPKVKPASSDADALDALMPKPRAPRPAEADPLDALMPKVKPASSDADALDALMPKPRAPKSAESDPLDALMPKAKPASSDADSLDALMPKPRAPKPAESDPLDALMPKVKPASSDADALDALMPKSRAPKPAEADPLDALMPRVKPASSDANALDTLMPKPSGKDAASAEQSTTTRRRGVDRSQLFGSLGDESKSAATRSDTTPGSAKARSSARSERDDRLSPDLESYLSPDMWRKINDPLARSGNYATALDRLNSLLHTISTYLPGDLVQEKMDRPVPGLVDGSMLKGCLLFSDVSGFTALSERLASLGPQGAEHLTTVINDYFSKMIDIIARSNGTLLKFAGDATLIYFPEQLNGVHVKWAVRAGLRMLRAMSGFVDIPTPLGPVSLSMKLGLSAGSFLAASIGSKKRMEYALIGQTVSQTLQAEGNSSPGRLVMNKLAAELLGDTYQLAEVKSGAGFFAIKPGEGDDVDEFEISRIQKRRGRRNLPWGTGIDQMIKEMHDVLLQIQSLAPYLASELLDRIVAHAHQRQVQSEYRPTTVMFCNFTGPDELLDAWGAAGQERVIGLLSAYFNDMNDAITRYGGIVSRIDPYSRGTKLLALFGAPVAHEDDPQRAVSAALAMNSALQSVNRRWAQKMARYMPAGHSAPLIEHRIGITVGETFAGQAGSSTRREYTVMGDDVNLAARLMSAASVGQILISDHVYEHIADYFVVHKLPAIRVKGKKKLIPLWQVDGPREDILLTRIRSRSSLIGRKPEMDQAWKIIQRFSAEPGNILMLSGPVGIGKSHLADSLLNRAMGKDWQVYPFQCRSYMEDDPYSSWIGLLRLLAGISTIDHPLLQLEKLERLTREMEISPELSASLVDLAGLRQAQFAQEMSTDSPTLDGDLFNMVKNRKASRRASSLDVLGQLGELETLSDKGHGSDKESLRRQKALQAVFAVLSKKQPTIVFFEDFQWMDLASRECLQAIATELTASSLVFLVAYRGEDNPLNVGDNIQLDKFTQSETSAMVSAILTEGLVEIIHEQSGGSPLFVEEITRWVKRDYNIDEARLKKALQSSDIMQKLVLSTLEGLQEKQREVARLAAVIGMEFRLSDLRELAKGASIDQLTLSNALASLSTFRIIVLDGMSLDSRYRFAQSIFRDVIYTSLSFERRRELHMQMVDLIHKPSSNRSTSKKVDAFLSMGMQEDDAPVADTNSKDEKLAYHYEMSEQWLLAAQSLNEIAFRQLRLAQLKVDEIANHALALLERCTMLEKEETSFLLQRARAYHALGDFALQHNDLAGAAVDYDAALASAPQNDVDLLLKLNARLALVLPSQKKAALADKNLSAFIAQHPEQDGLRLGIVRAWLAGRMGGDAASLVAFCREKVDEVQGVDRERIEPLLNSLAGAFEPSIGQFSAHGAFTGAALAHIRLGDLALQDHDFAAAATRYNAAADIWQDAGSDCGLALVNYRRAELRWLETGASHKALAMLETAQTFLRKAPVIFQNEPGTYIQKALTRIKNKQRSAWDQWQWQPFDDLFLIQYLLPLY